VNRRHGPGKDGVLEAIQEHADRWETLLRKMADSAGGMWYEQGPRTAGYAREFAHVPQQCRPLDKPAPIFGALIPTPESSGSEQRVLHTAHLRDEVGACQSEIP